MADTDIGQTSTTDMENQVDDYSIPSEQIDSPQDQEETTWMNTNWPKQLGVYKGVPEFRRAVITLGLWVAGKGYESKQQAILENITGWGEDTFTSICKNHIRIKRVAGDSYAQVIRNEKGTLINLKPLNPGRIRHVVNREGIIIRYEQLGVIGKAKGKVVHKFEPQEILHSVNNRIADEIHGNSDADAMEWLVEAKQEAMRDWKRIAHRATIRVLYIDIDDDARLTKVRTQYSDAIEKGEVMIIPCKRTDAQFEDLVLPPIDAFMRWMEYLDNKFYQDIGVPRVLVTSEGFTESGGKVGFLTFEPIYTDEQVELEADLWNQCAIKVKFNRPPSLGGALNRDEAKDTGQIGIQPADTEVKEGRE